MDPRRFGLSILTKIFLGFAAVIASFGGLAGYSEIQNHLAVSTLRSVVQDYVRTALVISEIEATQRVMESYLAGITEAPAGARSWLRTLRNLRPGYLRRVSDVLASLPRRDLRLNEQSIVVGIERELDGITALCANNDRQFDRLFAALDVRDPERAQRARRDLEPREREVGRRLRKMRNGMRDLVNEISDRVAADEAQSRFHLGGLVALAFAVALIVWIVVFRTLSPIRRMRETAAAVARGDLEQRLAIRRSDELGRLAEEFDRMTQALVARDERLRAQALDLVQAERLAAIGKMAAHITHEVRNPLSSIGLNAELLEDEIEKIAPGDTAAEPKALIASIGREIDRLTAITEQYLRFARLPDPRLQAEDLSEIVTSVADFVRPELEASGLCLDVEVGPGPSALAVDEGQIRQALLNLLRNAREATPRGGLVAIALRREPREAIIEVRDTGCGIPPQQVGQVFDAFFTTKEHGTGLGLPLVRQIVMGHGGTIECRSELGAGTTFLLRLPVAPLPTSSYDGATTTTGAI